MTPKRGIFTQPIMDARRREGTAPQVVISTLDPRMGGGVLSVTQFAYETAQLGGFDPSLLYNAHQWSDCLTVSDVIRGTSRIPVVTESMSGMEGTRIGRVLPEFELFNYVLNHRSWKRRFDDAAVRFGVGGTCLPSLPFAIADCRFGCWVGTTIEDERKVQKRSFGLPERIRYEFIRPLLRRYERYVLKQADLVLAQSHYTRRQLVRRHALSADSIKLVPVPIDTERYRPSEPPTDDSSDEVVFVGRFTDPRKNIELLLEAFSRVLEVRPSAYLTLIGDELTSEQHSCISELGIEENVTCLGKIPDIVPYLQRAAVFALPSRQEGLGIAGLEAMSCGTPVVATRSGGPEDYVIEEETGFLVPIDDAAAFADRIIRILSDDALRSRLSDGTREHVVAEYAQSDVRETLIETFQSLRT